MTYEFEGKTEKDAIEMAVNELGLERDQFDVEILETQKNSIFKKGYVKIRVHTLDSAKSSYDSDDISEKHSRIVADPLPQGEFEEKLLEFIKSVIEKMGYDIKVNVTYREEKKLGVKLESSYSSILIGRKGKNLDALQLLANIYAGRLGHEEIRVILDTENYRKRRQDTLENLAKNIAFKVKRTKRSVSLEPMNPYERRIIHSALQNDKFVTTHSEGEEPFRHVVVTMKK